MSSCSVDEDPVLECRDVLKRYYYYSHRTTSLREWFIRTIKRQPIHERGPEFILSDFNLRLERGEVVGVIGPNGSGKSTVLRLIAGIYAPTAGEIKRKGRVAAVMDLGAGFHPELTGAENVELSCTVLGLHPKEIDERYPEIVEFADIGDFIDTPVKYYSAGMQARLGFAVSMSSRPDLILIDEVLAVGDESFRGRCLERLASFRESGGTILMVSHDLSAVSTFCQRAVWLDHGKTRMVGEAKDTVDAYLRAVAENTAAD